MKEMDIIDYLLAKKKGSGSQVTVEALSVTENGTYSEAGKAYSPVTVNVPLPTNANERKSVTSYPVTDSANYPLPKCDVTVADADKCEVIVTTDNVVTEDSGVYIERQSGGGNRELDAIVGGSIVWNQLIQNGNFVDTSGWFSNNGELSASNNEISITALSDTTPYLGTSVEITNGHKYIVSFQLYPQELMTAVAFFLNSQEPVSFREENIEGNKWTQISHVVTCESTITSVMNAYFNYNNLNNGKVTKFKNFNIIDLTAVFGTTIADYIYSLEQSTAGSGIAWMKSYGYLTEDYYGYTANKIESVSVARHITRGVNQWDEEWEVGDIDAQGNPTSSTTLIRTKNFNPCKPNTTYKKVVISSGASMYMKYYDKDKNFITPTVSAGNTITTPPNCYYFKFVMGTAYGTTYKNDISINYPSTNTEYYAYHAPHTYPINPITLRGIPKLNASNQLYYDGDRYEASGRVTRKYGVVDLGTLSPILSTLVTNGVTIPIDDARLYTGGTYTPDGVVANYERVDSNESNFTGGKQWTIRLSTGAGGILIADPSWQGKTANEIKALLDGTYYIYALATPTTESTSPFEANQIVDANGTEEYIDAGVEAGSRDVAIPVGHDTKYINGKAYVKPLTAGTSDTVSMADMGIMPTSPMYISANGSVDVEYWKSNQ